MLVYKNHQRSSFERGETIKKDDLDKLGILAYKNLGPSTIGVEGLPGKLFEKDFVYPSIDEENIADKLTQIESELNNHGIDISFNLYFLADDRVHTKVVSGEKVTSVNRPTSSVIIAQQSKTSKPKNHISSFNILLTEENDGVQFTKRLHQSSVYIIHGRIKRIHGQVHQVRSRETTWRIKRFKRSRSYKLE